VKRYTVEFTPESEDQLAELYRCIANQTSPEVAYEYTEAAVAFCEGLSTFPGRGTLRNDIRPGLRVTNYRHRSVIAYAIQGNHVSILGVFYGGQDLTLSNPVTDSNPPHTYGHYRGGQSSDRIRFRRRHVPSNVASSVPGNCPVKAHFGSFNVPWGYDVQIYPARHDILFRGYVTRRYDESVHFSAKCIGTGLFGSSSTCRSPSAMEWPLQNTKALQSLWSSDVHSENFFRSRS
jgi:toxin ParE1/3/4